MVEWEEKEWGRRRKVCVWGGEHWDQYELKREGERVRGSLEKLKLALKRISNSTLFSSAQNKLAAS